MDIINKRIACLNPTDVASAWALIRDISRVVMGDAPLLDIFSADWNKRKVVEKEEERVEEENPDDQGSEALTTSKAVENEMEWMWQASLLSLKAAMRSFGCSSRW